MKEKLSILLGIALLFTTGIVLATTLNQTLALTPLDDSNASGEVSMRIIPSFGNSVETLRLSLEVQNLNSPPGEIFEGWLVDDETGYYLSLGAFTTNSRGIGTLKFSQDLANASLYDRLVITREPRPDSDPLPSQVVLNASLR